jgi:tetratricopeptide (TPR) repeat protein
LCATNAQAGPERSLALVAEAWKAWGENNQQQVEAKLTAALKEDPANTRASLGLYLLYRMQGKERQAWDALKTVLQSKENSYPYFYAVWLSPALRQNLGDPRSGALGLLEALSAGADPGGVLKAMANEQLGEYYQNRGELLKSAGYFQKMNAVKDWMIAGPFENVSASGAEKVYPPEQEFAPSGVYQGKNGIPAKWFRPAAIRRDYWIDFTRYFAHEDAVFYANTFVYSPKKQVAQLRVGTSGSVKVFLNDQQLFEYLEENNNDLDTYIIETELQEGWNRILIKCGSSEIEQCNFMLRLTDSKGEPIQGLEVSADAKTYTRRPGAPVKLVENFAEAFFREMIKKNPEHVENYILLAESYLRNDKAAEAELVLKEALARSPRNALIYTALLEAYSRGEKYDEIPTTHELIYSLDKNIPATLNYRIMEYLEKEEFDKAEGMIREYEKIKPESEELYTVRLVLYGKKNLTDKVRETSQKAYRLFPSSWTFVYTEALLAVESTQKHAGAISLIEKYLARNYDYTALHTLAGYHLQSSDTRKWLETFNKILELDPASTNSYYEIADVYFKQQDYANAEKMVRKALSLCPSCTVYWSKLGEIQRIRNEVALSKQSYSEALKYHPFDYDARRVLRELEGKPSIFSLFENADIKRLVAQAPEAKDYPESGAAILLQDTKRVVYAEGASELAEELLVKVFNNRGIDDFKEYWIAYNGHTQELMVEKAVVLKPNGTEIKADLQNNHVVFKTLEKNDTIYLKWNVKNYNSGRLFSDFWDAQYFNSFYPSKLVRYSLLVPQGCDFRSNAQNMPNEPVKKQTDAGVIHQWSAQDEPAVEVEPNMPTLTDVGKVLYISSIDGWESLVAWYADLARTKTKSSYEIKEQVEKLFAGKKQVSDEEKIETIYNFITENIRYSSVPFRQSGLVPQKARDVLVNKIGDCKDLATLCITMLGEVGVKAHYVLLNTRDAGQHQNALPAIFFNHCIVAVETPGGLRYLDLTAHNYPANSLPAMDIEAFSLLIKAGVNKAGPLPADKLAARHIAHNSSIEVKDDRSILVRYDSSWQGGAGAYPKQVFRDRGAQEREKMITNSLGRFYPGVKVAGLEFEGMDAPGRPVRFAYNFEAPNYVTEAGQFKLLRIPWNDRMANQHAPSQEQRKFAYYYWPYADRIEERIEFLLPAGYEPVDLGKEVKLSSAVADYQLSFTYADGKIVARRELINKKAVVTPEEYAEFRQFCNRVVKEDERSILLKSNQ